MGLLSFHLAFFFSIFCAGGVLSQPSPLPCLFVLSRPVNLKIVKIIDPEGNLSFEILDDEIIRLMKKDLSDRYKKAKEAWNKERGLWKQKHPNENFVFPKPLSPKLKILAKGYSSRAEAEGDLAQARSGGPFSIYQVARGKKKTIEIVSSDELAGKKYSIEKGYFESLKKWLQAKTEFEAGHAGQEFDEPRPEKPVFKVRKSRIRTMEKASVQAAKYMKTQPSRG